MWLERTIVPDVAGQVSAALGEPTGGRNLTEQWVQFSRLGVDAYYRSEDWTLAAVAIDACHGPQISFEGVRLVGRLPSELTPRLEAGADTHTPRRDTYRRRRWYPIKGVL